jgi:hypothetical protein
MRLKAIVQPGRPADLLRHAALAVAGVAIIGAAGAGSLALAQQGDTGRTKSRTIITTSDRGRLVSISSDYVRVSNAELVNGKVKVADGEMSTYHGNVEVRGRLIQPEVTVLLDGKTPPADFDATKLPRGAIDQVEMVNHTQGGDTRITLNVILAKSL